MQPKLYSPYKRWKAVSIIPKMLMAYPGLSLAAKAVWGMLASHAGEQEFAYPSQATLARECSLSRRCVQRALDELEEKQFIACLGLHRRNKVWGFLEHPILADSASNVRTSTNGSASDLRTTEENEPESLSDESKCAKMTQDSASNVRKIVRQNDASYMKGFMEKVHGKGSFPTIGDTVDSTLDPPQNARAPDDEDPLYRDFLDLWMPSYPKEFDREEFRLLVAEHGPDKIRKWLDAAGETKTCRRERVIPWLHRCAENDKKGGHEDGDGYGDTWR